jgi:hypothetical protein
MCQKPNNFNRYGFQQLAGVRTPDPGRQRLGGGETVL